jgi:hypothetical protein
MNPAASGNPSEIGYGRYPPLRKILKEISPGHLSQILNKH